MPQIITQAPDYIRFEEKLSGQVNGSPNTVGNLITTSQGYRDFISKNGRREACFEIEGVGKLHRATGTTVGLTSIDKLPDVIQLGVQQPMVGDLFAEQPTNNPTVRFIKENTFTNAADMVAEEGAYPEASFDLVEQDSPVRKIAVLSRTTEEILEDIQGAQTFFNQRIPYMVQAKEDSELLNGTGTGNRITGILNTVGIQTQAQGNDTLPDAVMKAITKIRAIGYLEPTGIVMNPNDWQSLVLLKDRNAQYFQHGPFMGAYGVMMKSSQTMWNLPVVLTQFISQGTILVGAFPQGATIHRRMGMTVETTNSDASDFKYGRMAIRATTRLTLACYRPVAFCTVTGSGAGGAFQ